MTRLFDPGPGSLDKLTPRQQRAYEAIRGAGYNGIGNVELGATLHNHSGGGRCGFCHATGLEVGRALRTKGLVQQRRRDSRLVWTVAGKLTRPSERASDGFPEGY